MTFVRETYRISWREIYWKVWSYLYIFKCDRCNVFYHISEMGNCHVHKQKPKVKMSLNGPLGSNYQYACCEQECNVVSILNQSDHESGCETQVHEVSQTYNLDPGKEKKITDRIIAHQLIILEQTGNKTIEKISIKDNNAPSGADDKGSTIKLSEGNSQPSSLVRPSSLNYKISLAEAVNDFIKKDMPCNDDQVIDVAVEDPKVSFAQQNNNSKNTHDELDDLMFDMTAPNTKPHTYKAKGSTMRVDGGHYYINDSGHSKDAWFKEEEVMRRKLEKGAIAQLKSRIAQANRAAGNTKNHVVQEVHHHDHDSDVDPNDLQKDNEMIVGTSGGAVNATQVQLNPAQVEEAK